MDKSEKRFERDIESFLISPEGGYTQFCGQDEEGNWVHNRQHDVAKCKPENAVMIGDRIDNDIVPAKQLGMKTIWIKQGFG